MDGVTARRRGDPPSSEWALSLVAMGFAKRRFLQARWELDVISERMPVMHAELLDPRIDDDPSVDDEIDAEVDAEGSRH